MMYTDSSPSRARHSHLLRALGEQDSPATAKMMAFLEANPPKALASVPARYKEATQRFVANSYLEQYGRMKSLWEQPTAMAQAFPNLAALAGAPIPAGSERQVGIRDDQEAVRLLKNAQATKQNAQAALMTSAILDPIPATILDWITDRFENTFQVNDVFGMGVMSQPKTNIYTRKFVAQANVGDYDSGDPIDNVLEPDYLVHDLDSCAAPRDLSMEMSFREVTAAQRAIAGDLSSVLIDDAKAWFGFDMLRMMMAMASQELEREEIGALVDFAIAQAGGAASWDAAPPPGSVYETLDPKVWDATLGNVLIDVDTLLQNQPQIRRGWNRGLANATTLSRLKKMWGIKFNSSGDTDASGGTIERVFQEYGAVSDSGRILYAYPYFPDDQVLLTIRDPGLRIIEHLVYRPIESYGTFREPKTGCERFGMHTRTCNVALRPEGAVMLSIVV